MFCACLFPFNPCAYAFDLSLPSGFFHMADSSNSKPSFRVRMLCAIDKRTKLCSYMYMPLFLSSGLLPMADSSNSNPRICVKMTHTTFSPLEIHWDPLRSVISNFRNFSAIFPQFPQFFRNFSAIFWDFLGAKNRDIAIFLGHDPKISSIFFQYGKFT